MADDLKKVANAAQSAGKAAKELKVVTDDHEERISAIEDHLESQPVTSSAPSPVTQPATTAAPAATVLPTTPQLRTDDVPDLPDPVVMVVSGGMVIDRVKRTWLAISQLQEDKRDLDAKSELSTPTPIRQASIPQRRPEQKEKPEKKTDGKNNLILIIVGAIIFLIAIATIIWAYSRSSAPIQTTTTTTEKKSDSNVQISLPANIEWLAIGVRGTICGTASGQANAGEGNPLTNPDGDPNRVMSDWCGHPYLAPGAPEGVLVGKDGPNGKTFIMGSSFSGVKINDELFVAINDASGTFQNNEGGYTLNLQVK